MILILMMIMMLSFCLKESKNLIGLENFVAAVFSMIAGLVWYSPFLQSPHESLTPILLLEVGD